MVKDGSCPKCGSEKVFSGADIALKGGPFASNSIPISITSMAALDNYVCTECGYLESYIADADKLSEIAEKWEPAKPTDDSNQGTDPSQVDS